MAVIGFVFKCVPASLSQVLVIPMHYELWWNVRSGKVKPNSFVIAKMCHRKRFWVNETKSFVNDSHSIPVNDSRSITIKDLPLVQRLCSSWIHVGLQTTPAPCITFLLTISLLSIYLSIFLSKYSLMWCIYIRITKYDQRHCFHVTHLVNSSWPQQLFAKA